MLIPVILSGGSGTRLWPLSRELHPKQFLPVVGEGTLLQETVSRLDGLELPHAGDSGAPCPLVVCNEEHRFLVAEQLREINLPARAVILEPQGRNTAPALTVAALSVAQEDPEAILLVMPADHAIKDSAALHTALIEGYQQAASGAMVTFGIVPTAPETGYGYIRSVKREGHGTARILAEFIEKPDRTTVEAFLSQGDYLWNSGMFMMKASVWNRAIAQYNPDIHQHCTSAIEKAVSDYDFLRLDKESFMQCPSDSIDYAVMEKAVKEGASLFNSVVIPLDAGWSDVGSWPALWELKSKDEAGNVTKGDVLMHNTHNSLLLAQNRLVATVGVDDLLIVETPDAVLVGHKNAAQDVKLIAQQLKREAREEHAIHRSKHRPWGSYECIDVGERFQVKRITVKPGSSLSLQMHYHRAEHWIVVRGSAKVTRGDEVVVLGENQSTYIPLGVKHRLENPGSIPLEMVEVQSGSYLGEDDIVRFDDAYGRSE